MAITTSRTASVAVLVLLACFAAGARANGGDSSEFDYKRAVAELAGSPASAVTRLGAALLQDVRARALLATFVKAKQPASALAAPLTAAVLRSAYKQQGLPKLTKQQQAASQAFLAAFKASPDALIMSQALANQQLHLKPTVALLAGSLRAALQLPAAEVGSQAQIPDEAAVQLFRQGMLKAGVLALSANASSL